MLSTLTVIDARLPYNIDITLPYPALTTVIIHADNLPLPRSHHCHINGDDPPLPCPYTVI